MPYLNDVVSHLSDFVLFSIPVHILVQKQDYRRTFLKTHVRIYGPFLLFALLFTAASFFISSMALDYASAYFIMDSAPAAAEVPHPLLIIDPGHGGEDGGASVGDTLEKDLNLMISEHLDDLCSIFGYSTLMTRTEDKLLYDIYGDLQDYTGKKKSYDLKNRLRMAEEAEGALYIGIHINKFSDIGSKGLQVYYSPNHADSSRAASAIQSYAKQFLIPDNDRTTKQATQAIYILNRIRIPAVLVECGFLSNPEELELLETTGYRQKIAAVIFVSTADFLQNAG